MAEANIPSASWSLDILREDRVAMACLVLSVTFLGCHAPPEAALDRGVVTRPEWRPLDADRATAEQLGREVVEAIGYEELIEIARRAGFVTTKKVKRAQRNDSSKLAMDGAAAGVFVEVYSKYAVAAGVASQVDSPLPGPGDLVGIGILVIGLFHAGYLALDGFRSTEAPASAAPSSTTAAPPSVTTPPAVSAAPTATAAPIPTTVPLVMPSELSRADQERWRTCNQLHDIYKATQDEVADYAKRMAPLATLLQNNKASTQQRVELCSLVDKRLKLKQREHKERSKYIELDCDRFDWFGKGTTKAQRLADHQRVLTQIDAELKNLYDLKQRFCQ
jgi:hypothetical protein